MVKKSKGRQKIEMTKMKNESNLQVTFSKRRSGLFKKASELCTLCAAEIAIIVFSPGRKVFSFGHPNVETVIDRFLNNGQPLPTEPNNIQLSEVCRNSTIRDLNNHLTQVLSQLESEKKKYEELKKIRENSKKPMNWWDEPIEGFDLTHALEFKRQLELLKKSVTQEASKIFQNTPFQNFYVGSSSNAPSMVDGGNHINPDFDQFNQRRMVNMNALYNPNMMLPNHHPLMFGNNSHGHMAEGFFPQYSMNYRAADYNQNPNLSFKEENISENEHHLSAHPPHPRSDYH
ncbi:unnamed protein product [Thlaspi arvense]|uniref:MADS-box domain-containing protein n=1 Tax=Thlaspi arvense TaxID=13288 RepID=A0AAU9SMQ8_THLAR|nr:unnamed protein product [Thlaspi arvense]